MMTLPTPPFLGGDEPLGTSIPTSLPLEVERWTTENVSEWLASIDLPRLAPPFAEQGIDGYLLLRLTERDLDQDLAIASNLQRVKVFRAIANLRRVVGAAAPDTNSYPTTRDSDSAATSASFCCVWCLFAMRPSICSCSSAPLLRAPGDIAVAKQKNGNPT